MNLSGYIDHTILRADCSTEDLKRLCAEAMQYHFPVVCVPPFYVNTAANLLADAPVKVATVVGFPMGYAATAAKVEEIKRAVDDGVNEIDVCVNICAIKSGNWNHVRNDIDSVTTAGRLKNKIVKIILETGLLEESEIRQLCDICLEIEPDFVKTSTGFNGDGATVQVVTLLRQLVGDRLKIKASGGIRTKEDALRLIQAGAQRIGTSAGVRIVSEL